MTETTSLAEHAAGVAKDAIRRLFETESSGLTERRCVEGFVLPALRADARLKAAERLVEEAKEPLRWCPRCLGAGKVLVEVEPDKLPDRITDCPRCHPFRAALAAVAWKEQDHAAH